MKGMVDMLKAVLIEAPKTDDEPMMLKPLEYDTGGDNLSFFYKHIGCDCIDIVDAYGLQSIEPLKDICLVVDDEGLFSGARVNKLASLLYGFLEHGQPIVGNVLVCKNVYTENGIETGSLMDEEVFLLDAALANLVELCNEEVARRRNEA